MIWDASAGRGLPDLRRVGRSVHVSETPKICGEILCNKAPQPIPGESFHEELR